MIEFKVRCERTDSDEGWEVTITTLPTAGLLEPAPAQSWQGDGLEWVRELVHDWMVDNVQ